MVALCSVKQWVRRMVRQIKNVHIDDCVLVSSATGRFRQLRDGRLSSESSHFYLFGKFYR